MKKILAIILAAVLVLSFAACKKNDINNDTTAGALRPPVRRRMFPLPMRRILPKRLPPRSRPK
ncbi:MAG: hypothetical protein MSA66_06410 [Oscillospiraceae bacterium]|nr:hypothetical protein [Oscillospiraceae bacterium]